MKIPKVIHYCWFGRSPLPELAIRCINSWKKYFPDYEIKQWNEDNYDVYKIAYTKEAYEAKKYAFVSDYARFDILYKYGGVYFDTDVEVIKSFDDILKCGAFMGLERDGAKKYGVASSIAVGPGLGMAANPGLWVYKEILEMYSRCSFRNADGSYNMTTVVEYITDIFLKYGLKNQIGIQEVAGVTIYPKEYFAPKDIDTKELLITCNTYSIHHYDASWAEWYDKRAGDRGPKLRKIFGNTLGSKINIILYVIQKYGLLGCIKKILRKLNLFVRGERHAKRF